MEITSLEYAILIVFAVVAVYLASQMLRKPDEAQTGEGLLHRIPGLASAGRFPFGENGGRGSGTAAGKEENRIRHRIRQWYKGKSCGLCGTPVGDLSSDVARAGILGPDGKIVDWKSLCAGDLADTLSSHHPLCRDCDESLRFLHNDPSCPLVL